MDHEGDRQTDGPLLTIVLSNDHTENLFSLVSVVHVLMCSVKFVKYPFIFKANMCQSC